MLDVLAMDFVQRALVAVVLAALVLGGLSPFVLARRMAFFSAALGQSVLTGVSVAVLVGEPLESPWGSVFGVALLVGVGLVAARRRSGLPTDTLVGVALAFTLGLGVCLLVAVTKRFNVHQLEAVMFGSVLTVSTLDLVVLATVGAAVSAAVLSMSNRLIVQSIDARLAAASQVDSAKDEYVFVALLTAAIVVSVKVMGALMVEAMLIVPAAAARQRAGTLRGLYWGSIGVALISGVAGLLISATANVPSGAAIVLSLTALFLLLLVARGTPVRR